MSLEVCLVVGLYQFPADVREYACCLRTQQGLAPHALGEPCMGRCWAGMGVDAGTVRLSTLADP